MTRYRARRSRARRWIERILLLAGVAGLGVWVWSIAGQAVYQDWGNWAFDRQARGERATIVEYLAEKKQRITQDLRARLGLPSKPPEAPPQPGVPEIPPPMVPPGGAPPIENNGLVGRLSIPRLDLHAMVREGVDEKTLRLALGHIPGTAFPGQTGNVGVAGHRDTLFRGLRGIHRNDLIRFETPGGSHEYRVDSTQIVKPQDVSVLAAHQSPELTLVTCYPFYYVGSAPDRFIVRAREVPGDAPREMAAANPPEPPPQRAEPVSVEPPPAAAPVRASKAVEHTSVKHTSVKHAPVEHASVEHASVEHTSVEHTSVKHAPVEHASVEHSSGVKRTAFEIRKDHSRELAPGISMGVTGTDAASRRVDGWMWVMPDRRTIWLRDHSAHEPVIFYGRQDGKMRELVITSVARNSVSGYLIAPASGRN